MMQNLRLAILKTLSYSDIFDYPLKEDEIHKFLTVSESKEKVKKALSYLLKKGHIIGREGYFALKGRQEVIEKRKERERIGKKKLIIAKRIARLLSHVPTVQFIGISGALSCLNAHSDDDIDFFVITKASSVWLTRLLATLFLDVLRVRRRRNDYDFKDKICLNMFVSEDALLFREGDLYLAREIAQLKPIFDRNGTYLSLIEKNNWWMGAFLPNFQPQLKKKTNGNGHTKSTFSVFEPIIRNLQIRYMNGSVKKEVLEKDRIFFHPDDLHYKILAQYENRIRELTP